MVCLAGLSFGQNRFMVRGSSSADVSKVAAENHLTLTSPLPGAGDGWVAVSPVSNVSTTTAPSVTVEPDVDTHLAETDPGNSISKQPQKLDSIGNAATDRRPVFFYGDIVRSAYIDQPPTALVRVSDVLNLFASGTGVVAVIDTGVDPNHPALKRWLVPGYDFLLNQPGYASELTGLSQSTVAILDQSTVAILDGKKLAVTLNQSTVAILDQSTVAILDGKGLPKAFGHGTMTAGIIHRVAPTARIMPLRAFSSDGTADLSDIVRAIYYAADHGANVISMSFSLASPSVELQNAINYATAHNVICVASAGNDGKQILVYPAGYQGVVSVGSTNSKDHRSPFSNFGTRSARMAAPGEAIITLYPGNNYAGVWGTSFSSAMVAGSVAVLRQIQPRAGVSDVFDALDAGKQCDDTGLGDARLDLFLSALYLLIPHH